MSAPLARYDAMRAQVAACATLDEAANIRDKAAALAAYARQRDDTELDIWMSEIRLRACTKIGELSSELEKAEAHGGKIRLPTGGKPKAEALAKAGLSTSVANRYEGLIGKGFEKVAGSRREQVVKTALAATEKHFAETRANGKPTNMKNLQGAVRTALVKTFGEPPKRQERNPGPTPEAAQYLDFTGAIHQIVRITRDPKEIAHKVNHLLRKRHCAEAEQAVIKINRYITTLRRLSHGKND